MIKFKNKSNQNRLKILPIGILCLFAISLLIQAQDNSTKKTSTTTAPQKAKVVYLERAEKLYFDQFFNPDAQILTGNVKFRHEGMVMYCDSAHYFDKMNSFEAFGNIRMEQGDTLFVFSDYLFYEGTSKIAKLRKNVRMENRDVTLITDSLDYDRNSNIGYYFNGGVIVDPENELTSWEGKYNTETKDAVFNDKVKVINEQFELNTELLFYNTSTYVAKIVSPSTIISDSTTIYSKKGWYNTKSGESELLKRSVIVSQDKQLTGDSILYNRDSGIAEVFGNMISIDTTRKVSLLGHYGYHNDSLKYSFATDSALLIDYSSTDSIFLHADTLFMERDSIYNLARGHRNVRFFRDDAQGVCTSFIYKQRDSAIYMYGQPVLFHKQYQITGDEMIAYMNDTTIEWAHIIGNAFSINQVDSIYYSQLIGREMKAYFEEKEIKRLEVLGNAESIYYTAEQNNIITGHNHLLSSNMEIYFANQKLDKLKAWSNPKGEMTPLHLLKETQFYLTGFRILDYLRPKDKNDVFTSSEMKKEDVLEPKKRRRKDN